MSSSLNAQSAVEAFYKGRMIEISIGFPPGAHSRLPNRELSLVGDCTDMIMEAAQDKQAVWMTLQIAWSGVVNEGRQLTFPTFPQERFMAYQAIIHGARRR